MAAAELDAGDLATGGVGAWGGCGQSVGVQRAWAQRVRGGTYRANRRHIDVLDALLRLDLRVDPRRRSRRGRGRLVLEAGRRGAVCAFTRNRAASAMRLGLSSRRRPGAAVRVEARARGALEFVAVKAGAWAAFFRHDAVARLSTGAAFSCSRQRVESRVDGRRWIKHL